MATVSTTVHARWVHTFVMRKGLSVTTLESLAYEGDHTTTRLLQVLEGLSKGDHTALAPTRVGFSRGDHTAPAPPEVRLQPLSPLALARRRAYTPPCQSIQFAILKGATLNTSALAIISRHRLRGRTAPHESQGE